MLLSRGEIADKILLPGILRAKFIARTSLKMLFVLTKCVTCLATLVLLQGSPCLCHGNWDGNAIDFYLRAWVDCGLRCKEIDPRGNCWFFEWRCPCPWIGFGKQLQPTQTSSATTGHSMISPQIASFDLLDKAYHIAKELGMTTHVGERFVIRCLLLKLLWKEHRAW